MDNKIIAGIVIAIVVVAAAVYMLVPMETPLSTDCQERQLLLKQEAEQLNYCTIVEDCEVHALYCPFECWVFANKQANFLPVKLQIDAYGSECGVCELACASMPPELDCIEGKCVVVP